MRPIDADELTEMVWREQLDTRERIADLIARQPTIERAVKRGKWKQIAPQSALCSQCGGALKSNGIDKTGKAYIFNIVYKYCPFCGADMRGTDDVQQI